MLNVDLLSPCLVNHTTGHHLFPFFLVIDIATNKLYSFTHPSKKENNGHSPKCHFALFPGVPLGMPRSPLSARSLNAKEAHIDV